MPGGAATAPERIFQRALQLTAAVAPLVAPLQRVFDALGLTLAYDTAFETARSVREEVCVCVGGSYVVAHVHPLHRRHVEHMYHTTPPRTR